MSKLEGIYTMHEGLCSKILCAPKGTSEEEIERAAGVAGTSRGWKVDHDFEGDTVVQCKDDPDREHTILAC